MTASCSREKDREECVILADELAREREQSRMDTGHDPGSMYHIRTR